MKHIDSIGRAGRVTRALFLALGFLGLPACYDFPAPLDPEPVVKLDPQLLGPWSCVPTEARLKPDLRPGSDSRLVILAFEAAGLWYRIRTLGLADDSPAEVQVLHAYPSKLEHRTVINVGGAPGVPRPPDEEVTLVVQTWLSPNVLQLDLIDDRPVKDKPLSPSSALRKTLLSHRPQAELFSPFMVCVRAKVEDPS